MEKQEKKTDNVHPLYPNCEKARNTGILDLKMSDLNKIPQAVFNFMTNAEAQIKECNFSGNELTYLQPQLVLKFQCLTKLNLSHNLLSSLPMEMAQLGGLEHLNISSNLFYTLPKVAYQLPHLTFLYAQCNLISEFDLTQRVESDRLELVDLRSNPLSRQFRRKLMRMITKFHLVLHTAADEGDSDNEYECY